MILPDTHTLIWFYSGDEQLPVNLRRSIIDIHTECFVSIASLWEITIKLNLGKLTLQKSLKDLFDFVDRNEITVLPVDRLHLLKLSALPDLHKDPFDRIIIAQSLTENIPLASKDQFFAGYGVKLVW